MALIPRLSPNSSRFEKIDRLGSYARPRPDRSSSRGAANAGSFGERRTGRGFHAFHASWLLRSNSKFRHLLTDLHRAGLAYFNEVGHVPGIHILGIKADMAAKHPWLPQDSAI